jgi:sugar phosphate isomerase/epimerase
MKWAVYTCAVFKNLNVGALGHGAPFDAACSLAKAHGFAGIDLDLGYLAKLGPAAKSKEWFDATGLKPASIGCGVRWREADTDADYEASLKALRAEAKLAAALGVTRCATWVMPASNTLNYRDHWNLVVPRLKKVARVLADNGIRFGLEFVGPVTMRNNFKYGFVNTLDGMLAMAAAIGPNVGLLLDCWHSYTAHVPLADLRRLSNADVVYVHVNDAPPGIAVDDQQDQVREMVASTGVIDIVSFVGALRSIGYDGPVTVEPFSKAVKAMALEDAVALTSRSLDKVLA